MSRAMRGTGLLLLAQLGAALQAPPRFTVDLSKPPERRWDGAVAAVLARHPYEYSFLPVFQFHNTSLFNKLQPQQWAALGSAVRRHWPETAAELAGIAAQFGKLGLPEVSYEYLTGWLYFHELAHTDLVPPHQQRECTGILVQAEDGTVLHGGNMDQQPLAVRNLTLQVRFVDGEGATVFQGVDWYTLLSTGVSRAVRKGLASVQENWRSGKSRPVAAVLEDIEKGVISQMLVFRHNFVAAHAALLQGASPTFEDFVRSVSTEWLAAEFYIVTAGPRCGEGVVIARNRTGVDGMARLSDDRTKTEPEDFFLCQANTDRWIADDPNDPRRTAAELTLRGIGEEEGSSLLGLLAVTSTYPVHNPHTAYTALMSAATGELHAYVREASCPLDLTATVVKEGRYCQPVVAPPQPPVARLLM